MIENPENNFSPQQSLQLIESMINRAKDKYAEDGFMYLLWGWLVFACSIMQFVLLHVFGYTYHYIVWLATIPVFIYQAYYVKKKRRRQKAVTYADSIISYV